MMNRCEGEEDPSSHRKKPKLSSPSSGLPEEMVLSCLARVSKSEHASLSLVSKQHRSLLSTPELYNFRTLLGCTENLIYLCLRIPPDPNPRWFTLSLKKAPFDRRLVPVRSYFYQPLDAASMVAHGFGIYVMGGRIGGRASSSVKFLDCRSHTWSTLPSMGVPRYSAASGVVDGKIYIFGGCDDRNSSRWGEVFDTEKQTWDALPLPPPPFSVPSMLESVVINEEKVVAMNLTSACFSYIPSESKWKIGNQESSGAYRCWHVIDNVVYCSGVGGRISWCEAREWESPETETTHVMEWREVMGLESLTETLAASKLVNYGGRLGDYWESIKPQMLFPTRELDEQLPGHRLCNSGNNMLIFWDVLAPNKLEIWCAEVSLERHTKEEIRANILWSQPIMTLDPPPPHQLHSHILHASPLNL